MSATPPFFETANTWQTPIPAGHPLDSNSDNIRNWLSQIPWTFATPYNVDPSLQTPLAAAYFLSLTTVNDACRIWQADVASPTVTIYRFHGQHVGVVFDGCTDIVSAGDHPMVPTATYAVRVPSGVPYTDIPTANHFTVVHGEYRDGDTVIISSNGLQSYEFFRLAYWYAPYTNPWDGNPAHQWWCKGMYVRDLIGDGIIQPAGPSPSVSPRSLLNGLAMWSEWQDILSGARPDGTFGHALQFSCWSARHGSSGVYPHVTSNNGESYIPGEHPESSYPHKAINAHAIWLGHRIQLDPSIDPTTLVDYASHHLGPLGLAVARTLQKYGAIMCENTRSVSTFACENREYYGNTWPTTAAYLSAIPWEDIRVIQPVYAGPLGGPTTSATTLTPTTVAIPTTIAPTPEPTTGPPTTILPTTPPPTTEAPTPAPTTSLTTAAPTTAPPCLIIEDVEINFATTAAPTTAPPTTEAPTLPPTTLAPTTPAPTTVVPTTYLTTLEPTTLAPTTPVYLTTPAPACVKYFDSPIADKLNLESSITTRIDLDGNLCR